MRSLSFQESLLWLIPIIALALSIAYLEYSKKYHWTKITNHTLQILRSLLFLAVAVLLLEPFWIFTNAIKERPKLLFLLDDSQSIRLTTDSIERKTIINELAKVSSNLSTKNYEVIIQTLSKDSMNTSFAYPTTNLTEMIRKAERRYEGNRTAGIVLISDGGHNLGASPLNELFRTPIYTVGIGDTTSKKDIILKNVYANSVAYAGNQTPIMAEIVNQGFQNKSAEVILTDSRQKIIARKTVQFEAKQQVQNITFYWQTDQVGIQRLKVKIKPLNNEAQISNNSREVFIKVIEEKDQILVIGMTPHPDLGALKRLATQKENFSLDILLPAQNPKKAGDINLSDYQLVIFHQIPNRLNVASEWLDMVKKRKLPTLFILGMQSDLPQFNRTQNIVNIDAVSQEFDKATPLFNPQFKAFLFPKEQRRWISEYPPLTVPFGNINLKKKAQVVLNQRIGNVDTALPLLLLQDINGRKGGVLLGEGIWQWSLTAAANDNESFELLFLKTIQYLLLKEKEKRFIVRPVQDLFSDIENVEFETQVFNESFEPVFGEQIQMQLFRADTLVQGFDYVNDFTNKYSIGFLEQGTYDYKATLQRNQKRLYATGKFHVKTIDLEKKTQQADFSLLQNLSQQSKGKFYYANQIKDLENQFLQNPTPPIISEKKSYFSIIQAEWVFFLLIALASLEWFIRKWRGSY